ncbi:RNA recognition motif domain-containing protein [Pseudobacteriovorax antillogorgiicola]|uniref:RNA recognition motif. (A.k.a. RRM, RBD, or RNP domain) n=1 Tax=Pseudobacteriovorax antillogorgiicola TaxID=1513793 RepID=A0A1Y6CSN4_9BACT|nr:RNA-binding protein [Pseudobacteriovorax antillogorgiicola]TCS45929.1 RNA recognition motif-containing protein [Pseudobacteriovorax antillogorgiicola]SMF71007.1 RNA recognition motif. (a.k.a. RRM, RBD, or RNP domain) [Pseudobacteriovorax antillogorgiicola]
MSKKLYVGGLSYSTTQDELHDLFQEQGSVLSAVVITDRDSGRSKGFGFVEMSSADEAANAIEVLDGSNVGGRNITVNEARERTSRSSGNARW